MTNNTRVLPNSWTHPMSMPKDVHDFLGHFTPEEIDHANRELVNLLTRATAPPNEYRIDINSGICGNLPMSEPLAVAAPWKQLCMHLMFYWPKKSGHNRYTVPDPFYEGSDSLKPEAASAIFYQTHNFWVGKYGALRLELLNWLIEQTQIPR